MQPNTGVEFVREVYALGKQSRSPDGAGADMVLPRDALAGLFGGSLVFILNTSRSSRDCVLVAVKSFGPLFGVVLLPNQK